MKPYWYIIGMIVLVIATTVVMNRCDSKRPTEIVTTSDTIYVPYQLPPVYVEGKTNTIIKRKTDTVYDEEVYNMVDELLDIRDSLHRELAKYIHEEIQIDTIVGIDTISFNMDYYTLLWKLDIRRGSIDIPHIIDTVEKYYDNRNDKWYGAGIGYVLGILTVVAILLGV